MNDRMKYWLRTFGVAALVALPVVGSVFSLSFFSDNPEIQSGKSSFPFSDFFRSWLILALIFTPIVSGLRSGESMSRKQWFATLGGAVLFGLLLIAPFAFMERWNNPVIRSGKFPFPYTLFFGLWLMPTVFFLGATPIVRRWRAGESILAHPVALLLRVAFLAIVAIGWVNLVLDQMPCFLGGVPGCD
jgi:hypothetical protein